VKNCLVTGGLGFIGSHFIRQLLEKDPHVTVVNLDLLTYAGNPDNLADIKSNRYHFQQGDINDSALVEGLLNGYSIDTVVNFAAESHVDRSIMEPEIFLRTNVMGTFTLLEAARKCWKGLQDVRLHHISTDEVYGSLGPKDPAFTEETRYDPSSPYSASKAAADHLVRAYHRTYHMPVTISNCSNNFGPNQYPEKLIPLGILLSEAGKPIQIYGDGLQRRDWLYVEDHCEAILLILRKGKPGETYNIGGDNERTNLEVAESIRNAVSNMTGKPCPAPEFVKDRPGHDVRYAINFGKIYTKLGWLPRHSLSEGIRKTVDWYLSNKPWVEAVQKKKEYSDWMVKQYTGTKP
jgi:dTDP-glucose 4,6-dehydratase